MNKPAPPTKNPQPSAQRSRQNPNDSPRERRPRLGLGFVVFFGSLLGTLLGLAADFNDAADTFERFRSLAYPELCIVGSNTILGDGITMASDWAHAFDDRADVRITVRGIGSVRGVEEAVNGGCVHVLAMSEPMTDRQYEALTNAGISLQCAAEIGYDVIAFVTDIQNRAGSILERNLAAILTGRIVNWAQISSGNPQAIRLFARPGSGTTEYVLLNVAHYADPDITDDQYFPPDTDYTSCASNDDCLDQTLATPGSLYWVSTAWMRTQPEQYLRVMPILQGDEAAINPLSENVNLDEYPSSLIRPLYLYVLGGERIDDRSEALGQSFLRFVRSVPGQVILEQYHFYTFFAKPREVDVVLPPGFEPLSDGRQSICLGA